MSHVAEKYGMDGLAERENAYRRAGDKYAHLQYFTLEEQDARNDAQQARGHDREPAIWQRTGRFASGPT